MPGSRRVIFNPMPLTHLGDMPIEVFLRDYWQQKPLLIRAALPDFKSPLTGDDLAGLALEEEVESRLVLEQGRLPWELRNGPFIEEDFARLPDSHWTLLVQAVNQWTPEVNDLLRAFRFLPDWRLDDIMVSYAADRGSVGPHFDYYDVFLLQGAGCRHWQLGQNCDSTSPLRRDTELNLLSDFEPAEDWLLEPGDMLYLPPGLAHWGRAEGDDCITYSIGFRAPSPAELLPELSQEVASHLDNDQRYRDPGLKPVHSPGAITPEVVEQLRQLILEQITPEHLAQWFGQHMTQPKYPELSPETQPSDTRADQLERHPGTRFAYYALNDHQAWLFVNGVSHECSLALAELLCQDFCFAKSQLQAFNPPQDQALIDELIHQCTLLPLTLPREKP